MSSKGRKYSNTDPIIMTILKGWNSGFLSEEAKKSFGNIDTLNLDKHTSFFIWNAIPTYLSDLKKHYKDDIDNLNILLIYGLIKLGLRKN